MGFKSTDRCLAKVDEDEPIFVLRAQDATAATAIRYWLGLAHSSLTDEHKSEVLSCLRDFSEWQTAHTDRVKNPD
jgi:hypothetical protein